jgi:hypothetical protein
VSGGWPYALPEMLETSGDLMNNVSLRTGLLGGRST